MTRIRRLAPAVADAIAAGEVVDRPAAVVKELVENSLDAGATRISIEARGAGRSLVRVTDDGAGIDRGELALAFERHATSKVWELHDLEAVATLGFRGEALASIAAVADVVCTSGGGSVRVRAGEIIDEGPAPALRGTSIEVRDLFANTPARLKFLKTDGTENSAMLRVLTALALCHPPVRFSIVLEGRRVTLGGGDPREVVAAALAPRRSDELLPAMFSGEPAQARGYVSAPSLSRGARDAIFLSVNGRPIVSRQLTFALEECYHGLLERGRFPLAVLDVTLDPSLVDVNVHPTKREVRFRDEGAVFATLQRAVRAALQASPGHPYRLESRPAAEVREPIPALTAQVWLPQASVGGPGERGATERKGVGPLRPLGQVLDGYLVGEGPAGVVLVDQHAAHERVLYERFLSDLRSGGVTSQPLLLPQVVQLAPAAVRLLSRTSEHLNRLGFEVEAFGPDSIRVLAAPMGLPAGRAGEAVEDLLSASDDLDAAWSSPNRKLTDAAASLACHSAVRFGDVLSEDEQRRLLDELTEFPESATCPHGRPTRLLLDWPSIKRHFRRNY